MIDTCVWLDIAKDPNLQKLVSTVEELIDSRKLELVLPAQVLEEFANNKSRIIEDTKRSIKGQVARVRDVIEVFGDINVKDLLVEQLDDIVSKVPMMGEFAAIGSVNWIEVLFKKATVIEPSDTVLVAAARRALSKKAPFHKSKNSMADAVIIESYGGLLQSKVSKHTKFVFITHNTSDFSNPGGNNKEPHPDFGNFFALERKSFYYINLSEALHALFPRLVPRMLLYFEAIDEPVRSASTILAEEDRLVDLVWYNRHKIREERIEEGRIKIIEDTADPLYNNSDAILKDIWEGALVSAAKVEAKYDLKSWWPWDDFEWGMLNGKLSALRWVLGQDWDELYT